MGKNFDNRSKRDSSIASLATSIEQAPSSIRRLERYVAALRCPLCHASLRLEGASLVCDASSHCFNASRKGVVNFVTQHRPSKDYDRDFFENRRVVLETGYYDHVLSELNAYLDSLPKLNRIVDVGCGEGYYAKGVAAHFASLNRTAPTEIFGFDISKEAVSLAARGLNDVCWLVSDLANMPFKDHSVDCLVNVFTPAHYAEFTRTLAPQGVLLKVIPGPRHLHELRAAFKNHLRRETYSNEQIVEHFESFFELVDRIRMTATIATTPEQSRCFVRMTPLLFNVDDALASSCAVDAITVDAELLVGRPSR